MSFFETAGQARGFLLLLYAGFGAAAAYDGFSLLRAFGPRWLRPLWDALWCLLAGACCALALALGGENRVRAYALLGLCCGAIIYCFGIRTVIQAAGRRLKKGRGR